MHSSPHHSLSVHPPCDRPGCRRRCASMLAPAACWTLRRRPLPHAEAAVADAPAGRAAAASGASNRHKPEGLRGGAAAGISQRACGRGRAGISQSVCGRGSSRQARGSAAGAWWERYTHQQPLKDRLPNEKQVYSRGSATGRGRAGKQGSEAVVAPGTASHT